MKMPLRPLLRLALPVRANLCYSLKTRWNGTPCNLTAAWFRETVAAPAPLARALAVGRADHHRGRLPVAVPAGAALSRGQPSFDAYALALGERGACREDFRARRAHGAGAADPR